MSGSVGPGGARLSRAVPADPDNLVPPPDGASALRVRTVDAGGQPLGEVGARVEPLHTHGGFVATFAAPVPTGTAAVELLSDGMVVDRLARSRPPTLRVLAPRRGTRVDRTLRVRWTARDPDGDALWATVEYAPNGASGWRTVHTGPSTGRADIRGGAIRQASRRGRVRVTVNDAAFGQARATSGAFEAAGAPPTVRIRRPEGSERLQAGQVLLVGSALDEVQRRLRGRSLTWFAGSERLGTGERLRAVLPAGRVTLRLRARDTRGRVTTAVRRLNVARVALRLRALRTPERVRRGARGVPITVGTSVTATLRAAGRSYEVGPRAQRIVLRLPVRPRVGVLRVPFTITAPGVRRPAVRETIIVLRS